MTQKSKLVEKQVELELTSRMIEEEIKRETKDKVCTYIYVYGDTHINMCV